MTDSKNPQHGRAPALDVPTGAITCGDTARRKLYELEGVDDRVEFTADALDAGRQAEEDEWPREQPAESADAPEASRDDVDEELREWIESREGDDDE